MKTHNLGFPRIGSQRELKKAEEAYWAGKSSITDLVRTGKEIRHHNWKIQQDAGIQLIPVNDFSFYDQMLDTSIMVGAIPERFHKLMQQNQLCDIDLLFAMARGYQKNGFDIPAMEMTKWFDTNYHYIVPEFTKGQQFSLYNTKVVNDFMEAKEAGINGKPVLIGPFTYLFLGKEKDNNFSRFELIDNLLEVYIEVLDKLVYCGANYVQFDEPALSLNLTDEQRSLVSYTYQKLNDKFPNLKLLLASYFECYGDNLDTVLHLPIDVLHLDLVRCENQLKDIIKKAAIPSSLQFSLGIVDGRNIWKNNFLQSINLIKQASEVFGNDRLWLSPSCSLLHVPCDLDLETDESVLSAAIKNWLAFAKQKLEEVSILSQIAEDSTEKSVQEKLQLNQDAIASKNNSSLVHNPFVNERLQSLTQNVDKRHNSFSVRKKLQHKLLQLPLFPTTTIGSFPQTKEVRLWRNQYKKGIISLAQYNDKIAQETQKVIQWQEEIGLDVLVHGEFERNDMVEYFGEQLNGFAFTQNGWVQSYGSRCVKPPIIYGDISRPHPMTVYWSQYAQSLTNHWVKGMLTGPVTILQWSFVRNDQSRKTTCEQLALAIRDEVVDLEAAGIKIIQIDEPAIREGLPLRKENWEEYLQWAVRAFRISASGVQDDTQIHTHMCYSEFNDIITHIADMDADVITIECSRSQMELLDAFSDFQYPNEIGPGVYDIHSARVPSKDEMIYLLQKAESVIPAEQLWVNPDCGLKTRGWDETKSALIEMVNAAKSLREQIASEKVIC